VQPDRDTEPPRRPAADALRSTNGIRAALASSGCPCRRRWFSTACIWGIRHGGSSACGVCGAWRSCITRRRSPCRAIYVRGTSTAKGPSLRRFLGSYCDERATKPRDVAACVYVGPRPASVLPGVAVSPWRPAPEGTAVHPATPFPGDHDRL